jgi:hypothetical protein
MATTITVRLNDKTPQKRKRSRISEEDEYASAATATDLAKPQGTSPKLKKIHLISVKYRLRLYGSHNRKLRTKLDEKNKIRNRPLVSASGIASQLKATGNQATKNSSKNNEIDLIFAQCKTKATTATAKREPPVTTKSKRAQSHNSDDKFWSDSRGIYRDSSGRRYTADGLPIYTEEELNIGKGGGTPLCPFDCDCCF